MARRRLELTANCGGSVGRVTPDPPAPHERRARIPSRTPPEGGDDKPRRRWPRPGALMVVLILLALNWLVLNLIAPPAQRVTVPYSPYFLQQVREGNVTRISPTGETVTGEFKQSVHYPD